MSFPPFKDPPRYFTGMLPAHPHRNHERPAGGIQIIFRHPKVARTGWGSDHASLSEARANQSPSVSHKPAPPLPPVKAPLDSLWWLDRSEVLLLDGGQHLVVGVGVGGGGGLVVGGWVLSWGLKWSALSTQSSTFFSVISSSSKQAFHYSHITDELCISETYQFTLPSIYFIFDFSWAEPPPGGGGSEGLVWKNRCGKGPNFYPLFLASFNFFSWYPPEILFSDFCVSMHFFPWRFALKRYIFIFLTKMAKYSHYSNSPFQILYIVKSSALLPDREVRNWESGFRVNWFDFSS